jgi:hypothetical protein
MPCNVVAASPQGIAFVISIDSLALSLPSCFSTFSPKNNINYDVVDHSLVIRMF